MNEESNTKTATRVKRSFTPAQREAFVKEFQGLEKGDKKVWLLKKNLTYTQMSRWIKSAKSQPGFVYAKRHNPDSPNPPVFGPADRLTCKEVKFKSADKSQAPALEPEPWSKTCMFGDSKSADKSTGAPDPKPLPWKIPPKVILSNPIGDHSISELNYLVKETKRLRRRNLLLEGLLEIQERIYRLVM
jgi:hypothetical protein